MKRSILITGGAGFIGSNYINYIAKQDGRDRLINLDKLTYAAELSNVELVDSSETEYHFVQGDICNYELVEEIFTKHEIDTVIHFAAESHVDNSIENPRAFIDTNIVGTYVLLQVAYKYWMSEPNRLKSGLENARFVHISTDEVYGSLGEEGFFTENTAYAPNSPYSASKASADMLARSYFHTYGLPVVTTNCSNNYGPRQHDEKLIPTIIRKALTEEQIPIYGDGKNIRDWLFVEDHCRGIELALHKGTLGETYVIGGNNERENLYIANKICEILDTLRPRENAISYKDLITYVTDRPGHDFRYAIDASKIENDLGWKALENFESGIEKTVRWYLEKYTNR
ncbi:dTDP-glucose 4,6-dehydratase [Aquimarina intermedia]|uniref:dTDP-glucose 4,6-dehydratase n=1 Tax=Aquimarina intermedia TaxID=350814 RepID=A0A5S5CEE9_9FLAO|nr:dTDP-glucose 4,6-dehydratase [Aquimarina intermedia]